MRISPLLKAAIVALAAAAWLMRADASLARTLVLAVGAAFLTFAWIMFSPAARAGPAAADEPATAGCREPRPSTTAHRVSPTPTTRWPRDVRCPASSRATARARRSTRR